MAGVALVGDAVLVVGRQVFVDLGWYPGDLQSARGFHPVVAVEQLEAVGCRRDGNG
jgi:hypothetical protein